MTNRTDPKIKEAAWCMRDYNEMISHTGDLNATFEAYDADHSGFIDRKEMKKAYKNAYKNTLLASKTKEERKQILSGWMDAFFDKYDLSGDGTVGKDEFKVIYFEMFTNSIKERLLNQGITISFLKENIAAIKQFITEDLYLAGSPQEKTDIIAAFDQFLLGCKE